MSVDEQAQAWLAQDPDPQTRHELEELIATNNEDELTDCFASRLQFGTAGLRGKLGPGPNRMNRVVVMQAAAGLANYLNKLHPHEASIVIGYDARHNSDVFASDTAAHHARRRHQLHSCFPSHYRHPCSRTRSSTSALPPA